MKRSWYLLLVLYLLLIFILTLKPFEFSLSHFLSSEKFWEKLFFGVLVHDFLLNIIMFIPFGYLIKQITGSSVKSITILGLLLAASIESLQLFLNRTTTIADVLANGLGTFTGAWLTGKIVFEKAGQFVCKNRNLLLFLYIFLLFILILIPLNMNGLSNWSDDYFLLIGNEDSMSRPWSGIVYQLNIYNRAMDNGDIRALYEDENNIDSTALIARYRFDAGAGDLYQNMANTFSLDLLLKNEAATPPKAAFTGLLLEKGSYIRSLLPAASLAEVLSRANQFSIELLFSTASLQQSGPARIVSLSKDTRNRNFTIGQIGNRLSVRIRTPLSGPNGSRCEYVSESVLSDTFKKQHLILTFTRFGCAVYMNANRIPGTCEHLYACVLHLLGFGNHVAGSFAFIFMLIIPVFFLLTFTLSFNPRTV